MVIQLAALGAAASTVECNESCSFFSLEERLFCVGIFNGVVSVGEWKEDQDLWIGRGNVFSSTDAQIVSASVFDPREVDLLLRSRVDSTTLHLWHLTMSTDGRFVAQQVWRHSFAPHETVSVHHLENASHVVRTGGTAWMVGDDARHEVVNAGEVAFQSALRHDRLMLATAKGAQLYAVKTPQAFNRVAELNLHGWVKHAGPTRSGWLVLEGTRKSLAVLTSEDLRPHRVVDLPADRTWMVAAAGDVSVVFNDESNAGWLVTGTEVYYFQWSGTAPLGGVASSQSAQSLWLTNGRVVRRSSAMQKLQPRRVSALTLFGRTTLFDPQRFRLVRTFVVLLATGAALVTIVGIGARMAKR